MGVGRHENRAGCRAWLAVIAALALTTGTAWGRPSFDAGALRRLLSAQGFTRAQSDAVLATMARAEERGLSAVVLESRVREGLARHAPPEAIQRVLDRRLHDLAAAEDLMQRAGREGLAVRDRPGSRSRLADSFSMGVAPDDVARVLPAARGATRDLDSVSRAAEVMGRLARQGAPPADTRDVLGAALASGWTRDQMDGLVGVFDVARRHGVSGEKTRRTLTEGIRTGKTLDSLGADIEAGAKSAAAAPAAGPSRQGSSASASPRSGGSGSGSPKGRPGVRPQRGPRTPPRGVAPRPPAPRPHGPRGPVHGPHR